MADVVAATVGASSGGSLTLDRPAGAVAGHVLVTSVLRGGVTLTPPAGHTLRATISTGGSTTDVYTKTLGPSEPASYVWGQSGVSNISGIAVCLSGAVEIPDAFSTAAGTKVAASVTPTVPVLLLGLWSAQRTTASNPGYWTPPAGMTEVVDAFQQTVAVQQVASGATGTRTATSAAADSNVRSLLVAFASANARPSAPIVDAGSPAPPESALDVDAPWVIRFTPSDPDGDAPVDAEVRWRQGAGAWTTETADVLGSNGVTNSGQHTVDPAPGTGSWEVQVRTADAVDFGAWSASAFATFAVRPDPPSWVTPTAGATVTSAVAALAFGDLDPAPSAWQVQALLAGNVVADSGLVPAAPDSIGPVPEGAITLRARIIYGQSAEPGGAKQPALLSDWAERSITVEFVPPATPTVVVAPDTFGANDAPGLLVEHINPTPAGAQPTVTSVDVRRQQSIDGGATWGQTVGSDGQGDPDTYNTVALDLAPGEDFPDLTVGSRTLYRYQVVARASSNMTSSESAWTA